ncbi:xylose isomerase [Stackebrandtia nassauensis]|uniref:Xylose isomerase n=1 Tax=Stackebrandtia nassauensis (strain DSM 44728 / CIP 108903 / NRRL B-16338 / NBRC 102104 / LLR-40K-21) TaxID=446470 RepID=D3QBP2_STANL|nr:xylose isomerase [Stackebrandtia nassauensis]ADD42924.1 xylose isomerase [Stackebrandtia nassauensis DSM 44728]
MSDKYTPVPDDKFSFGIWTVGWAAQDVFGPATRAPMPADRAVHKLAEIGAYGVNFHDNDVFDFDDPETVRDAKIAAFRKALDATGLKVTTATTNLFSHPIFKDGAFTHNDRDVRRFALAKVMRNLDLAAELGAGVYVCWGGREGAESGGAKNIQAALDRMKEAFDILGAYVTDQGYDTRFAIEPKPNEPRGHILLPTVGHALAFINELEYSDRVGVNPEIGHEEMAGLDYAAGIRQALWHGKLFHIDLNGQTGPRYDQDLRFGAGNVGGAFWAVDAIEEGIANGQYSGPIHFDFKPPRTEDDDGVWVAAAACMRNYKILRDKVHTFRSDPRVREALEAARVDQLTVPTLAKGETWASIKDLTVDVAGLAARGMAFERLDQLALEHLYGVG